MINRAPSTLSPSRVKGRVRDWEVRLNRLYDRVEQWAKSDPRLPPPERASLRQRRERMLEKFGVAPRPLPTLTYPFGRNRIAFTPGPLWVVGANGRVNLAVNDHYYSLIDAEGDDDAESRWQLVTPDARRNLLPFDKKTFLQIVDKGL